MQHSKASRALGRLAGLALLPALAWPAAAFFDDYPAGGRQAAFGGAQAALEDAAGFAANPALAGYSRKFETGAWFLSSRQAPNGPADVDGFGAFALLPHGGYGRHGTFVLGGFSREAGSGAQAGGASFGWSSWQLFRAGGGGVDLGASLRLLRLAAPGAEADTGLASDLGFAYRPDGARTWGFSVLNANSPSLKSGLLKEKAPRAVRLGYSECREDFTISVDAASRQDSLGNKGNFSLNPGLEHKWRTLSAGTFFTRTGLFLAERASAFGAGLGWKRQAAEISYGLAVPLTGAVVPAHSVSLTLRFGDRDVESEYERLVRQEIKYRGDLSAALDEAAARELKLKAELSSLKEEIEALSQRVIDSEIRKEQARDEKERLEAVVRRQAAAEAEMRALEAKRKADKAAQLKHDFDADWQAYLKLKGGGAPPEVLRASLERLVGRYQDTGLDISGAALELRGLLGGVRP